MRRCVLAVTSAGLLIVVAAAVWLSGSIRPLKLRREPEQHLAMTAEPGPEGMRVAEVLARAAMRVSSGDIAGARDMLATAEASTQGPVTFALAETYDPNVLASWGARGVSPDVVKAEALYRKALEFGVGRAHMRLEALNATSSTARTPIVTPGLAIKVSTPLLAEPASRVHLSIEIYPPAAALRNSFVRIRGLPPAALLSEGQAISPGAWAVPLWALATLSVILPAGVQGQSDVAISLVNIDGNLLAETRTRLIVARSRPE